MVFLHTQIYPLPAALDALEALDVDSVLLDGHLPLAMPDGPAAQGAQRRVQEGRHSDIALVHDC